MKTECNFIEIEPDGDNFYRLHLWNVNNKAGEMYLATLEKIWADFRLDGIQNRIDYVWFVEDGLVRISAKDGMMFDVSADMDGHRVVLK